MEQFGTQDEHSIDGGTAALGTEPLTAQEPAPADPVTKLASGRGKTWGMLDKKGASPAEPEIEDLKPLAPTHDENKGFMRFMPPLIKEMNRRGVPFNIDGNTGEITIGGFYKNGALSLEIEPNDDIVATDRRGKRTVLKSFDTLVKLNFDWWRRSTGRGELLNPDRPWLDEFLAKGWVKRQVIFVPRDEQGPGDGVE